MVQNGTTNDKANNNEQHYANARSFREYRTSVSSEGGPSTRESRGNSLLRRGRDRKISTIADPVNLKKRLGLLSGMGLIVGVMIGSGIFVSPAEVLERTGSVGMSIVVWAVCGVVASIGALAYAELGTMIPSSGAEYAYFLEAFGEIWAFLFSWTSTLVLKPSQLAIICLTFAQYSLEAFIGAKAPDMAVKLFTTATIILLLFINCYGVSLATQVQNIFAIGKFIAIFIICIGGTWVFFNGTPATTDFSFNSFRAGEEVGGYGGIAIAFYSGLWAYDGWNNLNYATEEIINPNKNLPRSIMLGIPMVGACYVLINVAYLFVMTPEEMLSSEAVAFTFGLRMLGKFAWIMPLAVATSTFGAANGTLFAGGRLSFATSRGDLFAAILSYIHIKRKTPIPGLIFQAIIAIAMINVGKIGSLIDFFSFAAWIFYGGAMLAVIVLRYTKPKAERPYKVPIIFPIIVLIISVYLILAPIIQDPRLEYLYAGLFIVGGLIYYYPFVHYGHSFGFMRSFTEFLQILLEVAPTEQVEEERYFIS